MHKIYIKYSNLAIKTNIYATSIRGGDIPWFISSHNLSDDMG